ncbi:aspartyl/asparaginyl beta-hydroxylase domain-containing protein [Celerinatantimonas sp. YJH-8]|uniref:aspartyl/asparaginyl beta-hydroxylase domain-containing protein n=1 Tax=Celerinatantimonas sp. YJH-8 TaxID=3228714 RepID=UPI0038C350C0
MIQTKWLQLPLQFNADKLRQDLTQITADEWVNHMNTQAYAKRWCCVPLYAVNGDPHSIYVFDDKALYQPTPILDRCGYFQTVIDTFQCEKAGVRLMSLAAGDHIRPHRDGYSDYQSGLVRIHIPIQTDPRVTFTVDGESIHFSLGHAWYLNAVCTHGVENHSPQDRIHLLIDCRRNGWIDELFTQAGYIPDTPPVYGDPSINDDNVVEVIRALERQGAEKLAIKLQQVYLARTALREKS